jgi:hypothetical protein
VDVGVGVHDPPRMADWLVGIDLGNAERAARRLQFRAMHLHESRQKCLAGKSACERRGRRESPLPGRAYIDVARSTAPTISCLEHATSPDNTSIVDGCVESPVAAGRTDMGHKLALLAMHSSQLRIHSQCSGELRRASSAGGWKLVQHGAF